MKYYILNSVLVAIVSCMVFLVLGILFSEQLIHMFGAVTEEEMIVLKQRLQTLENRSRYISTHGLATTIQAGPNRVINQEDGNLVIYNKGGQAIWSTGTNQP